MASPIRPNDQPVRKWIFLPFILSLLVHLAAGGTFPYFLGISIQTFEKEINERFQTTQVRALRSSVITDRIKAEKDGSGLIERATPAVDKFMTDLSEKNKVLPEPAPPKKEGEDQPLPVTGRRLLQYEEYKVVSRPGLPQISQQYTARGSRYSHQRIGEDIVAPLAASSSSGKRSGHGSGGGVAVPSLDEKLLTGSVMPSLSLSPTRETATTPDAPVRVLAASREMGYEIPLVPLETTAPEMSAADVRRDEPPEPPRPPELNAEGPGAFGGVLPPLGPDVETELKVYREPGNPKSFFRLSIRVKKNNRLETIRKNVLFVVDISLSIPPEEIAEIRKAVGAYLTKLHPEDKFNVVRFSEDARRAFLTFVNANPQRIETALEFIDKVPGQIKTDVYRVLHSIILNIFSRERPCHVFLITDGISTQGVGDTHRIVREIAPITRSNISIFTYDVGTGGNHYLLDLLSYRSRGRLTAVGDLNKAAEGLSSLCSELEDPVLMNLSVNYSNLRVDEVYPQILPNLYRKEGLVIYGQCEPGRDCAVYLVGQAAGEKWKQFLTRLNIHEISDGEPTIAKEWARGKIHYLIARLAREGDNPDLVAEVMTLGKKYNLPLPFIEEK